MSKRGPEGKIQDAVVKYAREKYDALCVKNEPGRYGNGGFLDFTIYPNTCPAFVIEFKAPGKKLTPRQARCKRELAKRFHSVFVIDDVVRGKKIIDDMC